MPPTVQNLEEIIAQLEPGNAGVRNIYNTQLAAIPGQTQAMREGLEVGKQNEFRNIRRTANASGNAFSGVPVEEQMRYVGEKYMPSLAAAEGAAIQQQTELQKALAMLDLETRNRAFDTREGQLKSRQAFEEAERDRAFQMQKQREALAAEAANKGNSSRGTKLDAVKDPKTGGWRVLENGRDSTSYDLAGYARETGKDIVELLRNGDADDRRAAEWYMQKIQQWGNADAAKYFDELKRDRGTAFYLGG